jgi:hypothetical protein
MLGGRFYRKHESHQPTGNHGPSLASAGRDYWPCRQTCNRCPFSHPGSAPMASTGSQAGPQAAVRQHHVGSLDQLEQGPLWGA